MSRFDFNIRQLCLSSGSLGGCSRFPALFLVSFFFFFLLRMRRGGFCFCRRLQWKCGRIKCVYLKALLFRWFLYFTGHCWGLPFFAWNTAHVFLVMCFSRRVFFFFFFLRRILKLIRAALIGAVINCDNDSTNDLNNFLYAGVFFYFMAVFFLFFTSRDGFTSKWRKKNVFKNKC